MKLALLIVVTWISIFVNAQWDPNKCYWIQNYQCKTLIDQQKIEQPMCEGDVDRSYGVWIRRHPKPKVCCPCKIDQSPTSAPGSPTSVVTRAPTSQPPSCTYTMRQSWHCSGLRRQNKINVTKCTSRTHRPAGVWVNYMEKSFCCPCIHTPPPRCPFKREDFDSLPDCNDTLKLEKDTETGCPNCQPRPCLTSRNAIRLCRVGETPTKDSTTHCPTCRPTLGHCTKERANSCATRVCKKDEKPDCDWLTCCCSCKMPRCDFENANISVCGNTMPKIDYSTGCPTCRRLMCPRNKAKNIPRCQEGEVPTHLDNGCQSCKQRKCNKTREDIADCTPGERTEIDESSHCPTCLPPFCDESEKENIDNCTVERPRKDEETGCPTCILPRCNQEVKSCAFRERPTLNLTTGCMSCKFRLCAIFRERIPICEDDATPEIKDNGCPTCRIKQKRCDLRPSEIPECNSTQEPELVDGCRSCRKSLPKCPLRPNNIPFCDTDMGETQTINENTGCVSCRRKRKTCDVIPECSEQEKPTFTEGCLSCRKNNSHCTREKFKAWSQLAFSNESDTRECEPGEMPIRNMESCSLSCIRPSRERCTIEKIKECRKNEIEPCDDIEEFKSAFDPQTCCFLCSRPVDDTRTRCNRTQFKQSIQRAPVCQEGQRPIWDIKHCGPSCNRPERQCTREQVARCYKNRPFCEPRQRPQTVQFECCKSCKPKPNTICDKRCTRGFICTEKGCQKSLIRKFSMRITKKELCDDLVMMANDTFREWIRETVNRFCEKTANRNKCQRYIYLAKAAIILSKVVEKKCETGEGEIEFEMEVAETEDEDLVSLSLDELEDDDIVTKPLTACRVNPYSRVICRKKIEVPLCSETENQTVRKKHMGRLYCCPCKPEPRNCTVKICDRNEEPDYEASCPCKPRYAIPRCKLSVSDLRALPFCAHGKKPQFALDSKCPDCKLPICRISHDDIPECPTDTLPSRNATTNCPTCRVATARPCREMAQKLCARKKGKCSKNQGPVCNKLSCCCSCYKPKCNIGVLRIPECESGLKPTIDFSTGCPSCRRLACSKELAQDIPKCLHDEEPTPLPNGCQSCKKDICQKSNRKDIDDCQIGEEPEIDESSNCPTCMRPFCNETEKAAIPLCTIERPQKDEATGCKTCKLPQCSGKPPLCTDNIKPELNLETGCMNCRRPSCELLRIAIPECRSNQTPERKSNGCWSCRMPIPRCFLKKSEVRVCESGEEPSTNTSNRCPTCRLGLKDRPKCRLRPGVIPYCDKSENPSLIEETGCFSCRVKQIKCTPVRWCKDDQELTKDENNCPNCRLRQDKNKCTAEKIKLCHQAAYAEDSIIPECEPGVKPTRDEATCCLSCVPPKVSDCDREAKEECRKRTLEPCTDDEIGNAFDPVSCCRTCSRPKANEDEKPVILSDNKVKCTKEKLRASLKMVPECQEGEKPEWSREHCAPSCSRPARQCKKIQVAQCKKKMPFCEEDERPTAVKGQCCQSCKKKPPTCHPACPSDKTCVTKHVQDNTTYTCRSNIKQTFRMYIDDSSEGEENFQALKEMKNSEFMLLIQELIERYCDRIDTQEQCLENADAALDSIKVLLKRVYKKHQQGGELEFTLEYALNSKHNQGRRLLQSGVPANIVSESLKNEEASEGMPSQDVPTVLPDCPEVCPMDYTPVCGTDGKTYSNSCALKKSACSSENNDLTKAYDGSCRDCLEVCTKDYRPVCGTDGETYSNACALQNSACSSESNDLTKAYDGVCKDCPEMCPMDYTPVCGTDGVTYSNSCALESSACSSEKNDLTKAYDGACREVSKVVEVIKTTLNLGNQKELSISAKRALANAIQQAFIKSLEEDFGGEVDVEIKQEGDTMADVIADVSITSAPIKVESSNQPTDSGLTSDVSTILGGNEFLKIVNQNVMKEDLEVDITITVITTPTKTLSDFIPTSPPTSTSPQTPTSPPTLTFTFSPTTFDMSGDAATSMISCTHIIFGVSLFASILFVI